MDRLKKIVTFLDSKNTDEIFKSKPFILNLLKANEAKISKLTLDYLSERLSNVRICSFTRRWNHVMMWSHYSKGGSGAVLIFDKDELIKGTYLREPNSDLDLNCSNYPLSWVQYKNSPPIINPVDIIEAIIDHSKQLLDKINKEIAIKCVLTKFKSWRYEQESRLILRLEKNLEDRPVLYRYPSAALKGLLIGNKCSEKKYVELANALPDETKVHLACQAQSKYKFEIVHTFSARQIKSGEVSIVKKKF